MPSFCCTTAWPDVKLGMGAIRKLEPPILMATLSNGNLRLLIDIVRTLL